MALRLSGLRLPPRSWFLRLVRKFSWCISVTTVTQSSKTRYMFLYSLWSSEASTTLLSAAESAPSKRQTSSLFLHCAAWTVQTLPTKDSSLARASTSCCSSSPSRSRSLFFLPFFFLLFFAALNFFSQTPMRSRRRFTSPSRLRPGMGMALALMISTRNFSVPSSEAVTHSARVTLSTSTSFSAVRASLARVTSAHSMPSMPQPVELKRGLSTLSRLRSSARSALKRKLSWKVSGRPMNICRCSCGSGTEPMRIFVSAWRASGVTSTKSALRFSVTSLAMTRNSIQVMVRSRFVSIMSMSDSHSASLRRNWSMKDTLNSFSSSVPSPLWSKL
mmetsp:Transcript_15226/g.45778  ORF Transcript_15226/g.45778 Transcript_15226/m.45778 type:complete len:332 (-) Transcript_15226:3566-4561(-)